VSKPVVHMRDREKSKVTLGGISLCGQFGIWCLGLRTKSTMSRFAMAVTCKRCLAKMKKGK